MSFNLDELLGRTQAIREATIDTRTKQRIAEAAAALNDAGDNQARVSYLNESVLAMTTLCYTVDPDGVLRNVDRVTYRLLRPAPWGRSGWKHWHLRAWEGVVLGRILRVRCEMRRAAPVFDYNEFGGRWYLNYRDHPRLDLALAYWKNNPVLLKDWRLFADAYRAQAQDRMDRLRG